MKILSLLNLVAMFNVSDRMIQRYSKKAKDNNQSHITIKSQTFYFRNKLEGKGYEFCEVPFSELSVCSPSDSSLKDTYMAELQEEHTFREISVSNEIKLLKLTPFQVEQIDFKELVILEANKTRMQILEFLAFFTDLHFEKLKTLKISLNKSNLKNWRDAYKESGRYGLMKKSGKTTGNRWKLTDSIIQKVEDMFFAQRGNITAPNIYKLINAEAYNNKELTNEEYKKVKRYIGGVISLGTVKNKVAELKKTDKYLYLNNPDKYKNSFLPAFGDMRAKATYVNHYWEIDSTQLDAFAKDGNGETTWQLLSISDIFTGMKVITVAKTSNSYAIAELLYKAFHKLGIPQNMVTDNGKDYLSNHIIELIRAFGINHVRTEPFSGEQKPFVERHFGTIQNSFTELLNGFKGHDVAGFKAIQSQVAKSSRLLGNAPDKEIEFIDVIAKKLDEWVDNVYAHDYNRSLKATPYEVYESQAKNIRRENMENLAFLFGKRVEVKIGKKGITYKKKTYNNKNGKLGDMVGKTFHLALDFIDNSLGYLFDLEGKFIDMVTDEKISIHGAVAARKASKLQIKEFERENKALKDSNRGNVNIDDILAAGIKANENYKPIESIGGVAITQNSKILEGLVVTGKDLNAKIKALYTVNEEPDLERHIKAQERLQAKPKKRPKMTYDELLLGKLKQA